MHKRLGTVVVILIIAILVLVPGFADRCLAFLLIGAVPYTNITLAPTAMLIIYALFLAVGIFAIASELFIATNPVKRESASRNKARRKVHKLVKTSKARTASRTKKRYQSVVEH